MLLNMCEWKPAMERGYCRVEIHALPPSPSLSHSCSSFKCLSTTFQTVLLISLFVSAFCDKRTDTVPWGLNILNFEKEIFCTWEYGQSPLPRPLGAVLVCAGGAASVFISFNMYQPFPFNPILVYCTYWTYHLHGAFPRFFLPSFD